MVLACLADAMAALKNTFTNAANDDNSTEVSHFYCYSILPQWSMKMKLKHD